jgi:hypothetical protein
MSTGDAGETGTAAAPPGLGGCLPLVGGLALTGLLHGLASLAVIVVGSATREGSLIVFAFWAMLGLAQWIYMLPAALLARFLRWRGLEVGLWVGGGLGLVFTALLWLVNSGGAIAERITGETPANVLYSGSDSVVVAAGPDRVTVRFTHGKTETYEFTEETRFLYLGPAHLQQRTPAGPSRLVPGAQVGVDWVRRGGKPRATLVRIWVTEPE